MQVEMGFPPTTPPKPITGGKYDNRNDLSGL